MLHFKLGIKKHASHRNSARSDPFSVDEARSHRSDHGSPAAQVQSHPKTEQWFDAGAVSRHQMLYANLPKLVSRPTQCFVICREEVESPHERVDRQVLNGSSNLF